MRSSRTRELLLVAALERLARRLVEVVEALRDRVVDLELALAHQPHDHCCSSFCVSPGPSSAFICSSSSSTWDFETIALELAVELRSGRR